MSAKITKLRTGKSRVRPIGEAIRIGPTQRVSIFASTAAEIGTPLVELRCPFGEYINLKPEQAEKIGFALIDAAKKARA